MEKILVDDIYELIDYSATKAYINNVYAPGAIRNKHFRGKKLSLTPVELADRCADGIFNDLFIGDEITTAISYNGATVYVINTIAGFNPYINTGDNALTQPHIALVTKDLITTSAMNTTATAEGGYLNATIMQGVISKLTTELQSAFSNRLINARWLFSTRFDNTKISAGFSGWTGSANQWEWSSATVRLLSVTEVYENGFTSSEFDSGQMNCQLPLFSLCPAYKIAMYNGNRMWYYTWNISCDKYFCGCHTYGYSDYHSAQQVGGVRLLYLLG